MRNSKVSWSPESLYVWDVRAPPASSAVEATVEGGASTEAVEGSGERKRAREDGDDGEDQGVEEDEETLRPASAFNPLLFRALQSVAGSLPQPLPPPVAPAAAAPAAAAPSTTAGGSVRAESVATEVEGDGGEKSSTGSGTGIKMSATGKRKPRKMA